MPSNVDLESIRFSLKKHKMAIYITISRTSTFNGMAGFKTEAEKTYLQCWLQWRFIVFDQLHHKTCKIAFLSRFTRRHIDPYPWWFHFVQPSIFHSTAGKWQSWSLLSFWVFRNVAAAAYLSVYSWLGIVPGSETTGRQCVKCLRERCKKNWKKTNKC